MIMRLDVLPILSTLRRHRLTATLLVLQIALTCAIVSNAIFLIGDRLGWMMTPTGIAEDRLMRIVVSDIGRRGDIHARAQADLAELRGLPGVEAATIGNSLPFSGTTWNSDVSRSPVQGAPATAVTLYYGEGLAELLGSRLVAGRFFRSDEYAWLDDHLEGKAPGPTVTLITRELATRLFRDDDPLGRTLYMHGDVLRVVGVLERLPGAAGFTRDRANDSIVLPWRMVPASGGGYIVRAREGETQKALVDAVKALKRLDPRRVIVSARTYPAIRARFFADDRATAVTLAAVSIALLVITALGIVGLASFWVGQRRRQIGIRRALGASRKDILRYFQTENFLLASMGIGLGMVLAYGINIVLMREYELPGLPLVYLPVGAAILWALGQAAVLAPALRAASVPPVVATRG
ncbi:ABC transporter permease [Luteibacter sp. 329MFSha]|uniref:ABC transporter permease n=1 Tax=Luteibacter sp. 329MFSha TaxID=1798239 RepID=UPI000B7E96CF|nr:ABC transporter permease [Luteibacter sp. 329MFSha]